MIKQRRIRVVMGVPLTESSEKPYARFAAASLLIIAALTVSSALLLLPVLSGYQRQLAGRNAERVAAEPLRRIFADSSSSPGASAALEARANDLVESLLDGGVYGAAVWDSDGDPVYEAGEGTPPEFPGEAGLTSGHSRAGDGTSLLATTVTRDGLTVSVATDAAPLDEALASTRNAVLTVLIVFSIFTWGILQGAFWFGFRTFSRNHVRLAYFYDKGAELRASLDLHDVLTRLVGDATLLSRAHYAFVALVDHDNGELHLKTTYEHASGVVAHHQRALDDWYVRRCIATNTTITGTDANGYRHHFGPETEFDRSASLLAVPMSLRERVVGAVVVIRNTAGFSADDVHLVEELAGQAVTAIEQAQLFARVRSDANEIESSYDSTLKALMAALDAKDEVTEGHCERVAKMTTQLARAMGVSEQLIVHIERGALLHDVGKIGVPDEILKKPKALNQNEWEAMRKHPLLAGLMVSKIGFLEPALPILLYHHERYDGGGYPFGLAEDNIPVEARIFSVIDSYDAMTSDRPYREAMSHADAMREVRAHAGTQFDPVVVAAFDQLLLDRPELRQRSGTRILHTHDDDEPVEDGEGLVA